MIDLPAARERARLAQALLDDETFRDVMVTLKTEYLRQWGNTAPTAPALREEVYFRFKALEAVEGELRKRITDAAVIEGELERAQKRANVRPIRSF